MNQVDESTLSNLYEILLVSDSNLEAICARLNLSCSFDEQDDRDRRLQLLLRELREANRVQELLELLPELAPDLPYHQSLVVDLEDVMADLPMKMAAELSYDDFDRIYTVYPRGLPYAPLYRQKQELAEDLISHARANQRLFSLLESIRKVQPNFRPVEKWDDYWREVVTKEERVEAQQRQSAEPDRRRRIWRPEQVSVANIYRQTFTVFSRRPVQILLVNLPLIVLSAVYVWLFTEQEALFVLADLSSNFLISIVLFLVSLLLLLYVLSLGMVASNIATMIASSDFVLGRRTSVWGVYRRVLNPYMIRGHLDLVKYGLALFIGVMIAGVILGLMSPILVALLQIGLLIWIFFAFFLRRFMFAIIIAVEKTKFVRAYERSQYLASGVYGKIFATIGVTSLLTQIPMTLLGFDYDVGFFGDVSITINWPVLLPFLIVALPLLQIMTAVIYYELRQVKEGYNEEMLALDLGYAPIIEHINL